MGVGVDGIPSDYVVSTQLQLLLFCCWGCGCCWAVTKRTHDSSSDSFECKDCEKSFLSKSKLYSHQVIHSKFMHLNPLNAINATKQNMERHNSEVHRTTTFNLDYVLTSLLIFKCLRM